MLHEAQCLLIDTTMTGLPENNGYRNTQCIYDAYTVTYKHIFKLLDSVIFNQVLNFAFVMNTRKQTNS